MKNILTLILLFAFTELIAQNKPTSEIIEITPSELKFTDIKTATDIFSFRLENLGQTIEFRILPDSTKIGTITNFVTESSNSWRKQNKINQGKIIPKLYFQKLKLTELEIEKAIELIDKYKITYLQSDSEIEQWKPVFDGEWFGIIQKVNGVYKEKTYGNPKSQENLNQAKVFLEFHADLDNQIKFTEKFNDFFSGLNYGCYSDGSTEIVCKKRKVR